jgi:hypothetical protein
VNINAVNFRNFLYIDFFLVEIMIVFRTTLVVLLLLLLTRSFAFAFANDEANNDDDDDDHEFIIKQVGDRNFVTLEVPPYLFKKKKDSNKDGGKVLFSCNGKGCQAYAHATKHIKEDGEVSFSLLDIPKNHNCTPSPVQHLIKRFKKRLCEAIAKEPTRSMHDIYTVLRAEFTSTMSEDMKIAFIQEIPNFESCNSNLYKLRKMFIPNAPKTQLDLDTDTPFFKFANGENSIKINTTLSGGRRIIGLTSDAALSHLARGGNRGQEQSM